MMIEALQHQQQSVPKVSIMIRGITVVPVDGDREGVIPRWIGRTCRTWYSVSTAAVSKDTYLQVHESWMSREVRVAANAHSPPPPPLELCVAMCHEEENGVNGFVVFRK